MTPRISHIILAIAVIVALLLLAGEATAPLLYTAANTSTAAHVDPSTFPEQPGNDADALIPLMGDLLGATGTLTLNIKLKDYESAEHDLARYAELSAKFDRLVITLDASGTDIGEFQRNNRENLAALTTLLNDTRQLEGLQRVEIDIRDDEGRNISIAYEGEALQQEIQGGFRAYAEREEMVTGIADHYSVNATPYRESITNFAEIVNTTEERHEKAGGGTPSPLSIAITPGEGRYGDTLSITGAYAGGTPKTPVKVYVDSRVIGNASLDENGNYSCSYPINRIPAGLRLVHAAAGPVYSAVAPFKVLPGKTVITLAVESGAVVVCTGNLTTAEGRPISLAQVLLRVDDTGLTDTETDQNGTYTEKIILPAGEHTIRAEFNAEGYPLNASESPVATITVRNEGLSPLPFMAAIAAALGSGWYLRRRQRPAEKPGPEPSKAVEEETPIISPNVEIAGLPPRDAATVLFCALRARLDLADTKTPRDCARIAPAHAGFFERYEQIRYAGETPTEEELRTMKEEAVGGDQDAA